MEPARRRVPGWLWVVVPMLLSALVFGAIAVAVRSSGEDEGDSISGPAAQLPAVVTAAQDLLAVVPPDPELATALGQAYGEVAVGLVELGDGGVGEDLAFAEEFDRLPDAEARLLGRSLAQIQTQLSPTEVDGSRGDDDRAADIVFALQLARATIQAMDPDGTPRAQALAMLPFKVQDLTGFDEIAETFAAGDLNALAARIDSALADGGAADLISSVVFAITEFLPAADADVDYAGLFQEGYAAGSR